MKKINILLATLLTSAATTQAATISWSSAVYTNTGSFKQFLGTGQFLTTGTEWVAENSGENAVAYDGINFNAGSIAFGGTPTDTYHQAPADGGTALSRFATVGTTGADTVTLGNGGSGADLGIGNTYRIQLLVGDGVGPSNGRTISVDGINQGAYGNGTASVTWGDFLLVTGTFVADATSQTFTMEAFDGATSLGGHLNGILVHQTAVVPEPSSTALLGLGGLALILRRRK